MKTHGLISFSATEHFFKESQQWSSPFRPGGHFSLGVCILPFNIGRRAFVKGSFMVKHFEACQSIKERVLGAFMKVVHAFTEQIL